MADQNECRFSGVVEQFAVIATKTGTPMVKLMLLAGRERVSVVAFRDLAERTRLNEGDRVELAGPLQSNSWEGQDGVRRYGWQIIANRLEIIRPAAAPPSAAPGSRPVQTVPPGTDVPF